MKKSQPRTKYWNTMVAILDGQFPKGECKNRGEALVMLSYIEMMLQGFEFDDNGMPKEGKIYRHPLCGECMQVKKCLKHNQ